jgi:hypothetical protein
MRLDFGLEERLTATQQQEQKERESPDVGRRRHRLHYIRGVIDKNQGFFSKGFYNLTSNICVLCRAGSRESGTS